MRTQTATQAGEFTAAMLHYGPGPHPDGTPQSVHGGGAAKKNGAQAKAGSVKWVRERGNTATLQIVPIAALRPNPNEIWTERYVQEVAPRLRRIADGMLSGRPITALTVARHGNELIVIDGRHRLEAARLVGISEIGIQIARREWTRNE